MYLKQMLAFTQNENQQFGFMTRSNTKQAEQSHNKNRSLKLWIYVEEELHYPNGQNKGADQLICVFILA